MTRDEFSAWIEQHYSELLKVARKKRYRDPEDVVQNTVAGILGGDAVLRTSLELAWPFAVSALRGYAHNIHTTAARQKTLRSAAKGVAAACRIHSGWKRPKPTSDNPQGDNRDMGNR